MDETRLDEMAFIVKIDFIFESHDLVFDFDLVMVDHLELSVQDLQVLTNIVSILQGLWVLLKKHQLTVENEVDCLFSKIDFILECSFL